jgi:hypothetical protein
MLLQRLIPALVFPSVMLVPSAAFALRVVALAPQIKPPSPNEIRDRFHESVVRGLAKSADAVPVADVRMWATGDPKLFQCDSGACAGQVAAVMKADRVVVTQVETAGKTYSIKLHAFDADGQDAGTANESCDICTVREAATAVEHAAEKLSTALASSRPVAARPKSEPPPKVVIVEKPAVEEDEPRPSVRPASTAAHPAVITPAVETSTPTPVTQIAQAEPAAVTGSGVPKTEVVEKPPAGPPYRALGYTALAVGVALIVPTAVFGYYAGKGGGYLNEDGSVCTSADPVHTCKRLYDYKGNTAGAVVAGIGSAFALTTGAVLLYIDHKRRHPPTAPTVGVGPLPGGFAVAGRIEF